MMESPYYTQECPTCGRSLHIRVEYLGRELVCQHCRGQLVARDPAMGVLPVVPTETPKNSNVKNSNLLERADELLGRIQHDRFEPSEQRRCHPR